MSIIYVCTCQQENPVHGLVFLSSLLKTKSERAKNCKDLIKNETKNTMLDTKIRALPLNILCLY